MSKGETFVSRAMVWSCNKKCVFSSVCVLVSVCSRQCVFSSVCVLVSVCSRQCVFSSVCVLVSVCSRQCVFSSVCVINFYNTNISDVALPGLMFKNYYIVSYDLNPDKLSEIYGCNEVNNLQSRDGICSISSYNLAYAHLREEICNGQLIYWPYIKSGRVPFHWCQIHFSI